MRRISAFLLALIMLNIPSLTVCAADYTTPGYVSVSTVRTRLAELENKLVEKYFTVDGKACTNNVDANCYTINIVKSAWFKKLFGTISTDQFPKGYTPDGYNTRAGYSCAGFAAFAHWYLFRTNDTDQVNTKNIGTYSFDMTTVKKYAKVGDLIRLDNEHSAVIWAIGDERILVLDGNQNGDCKVQKSKIYYSRYSTFTISRATKAVAPTNAAIKLSAPVGCINYPVTITPTAKNADSYSLVIKNSSSENVFSGKTESEWIPEATGTYTVSGSAKNGYGSTTFSNLEFTVIDGAVEGLCGDGKTWKFETESGKLTVMGSGDMDDYNDESAIRPWEDYHTYIKSVTISEGITSVGTGAFKDCDDISSIVLPTSLISVGKSAFSECNALTEVEIPDSVNLIDMGAFIGCENLRTVSLGSGVNAIRFVAFGLCENIETISYKGTQAQWESITVSGRTGDPWATATMQFLSPAEVIVNNVSVELSLPASAGGTVYIAAYDSNGKMLSQTSFPAADVMNCGNVNADYIKIFWLNDLVPLWQSKELTLTE